METSKRAKPSKTRNTILKKYYGIKETETAPVVEDTSRPFDLDGDTFNASKYFAYLLKEKSLQSLVTRDNNLVAEIKEIDGDMKTLVYENYSKFISANDTIRKMKSNVEDMESEMNRLNENIQSISSQSQYINDELDPDRTKIQQLSVIHNSLKKLQFLFELPNRLQRCLVKGRNSQAVKYYTKAGKLLKRYQHMPAFKGIESDCTHIMEKVKTNIWNNMMDTGLTFQRIAEETGLLVLLGEDNHKLWARYLEIQLDMLRKKQQSMTPTTVQDLLAYSIVPLEDIVHHFMSLFLNNHDLDSMANLDNQERDMAKDDLLNAITPCLDDYFQLIDQLIKLPASISQTPLKQVEYLYEFKSTLLAHAVHLNSVVKVNDRMESVVAEWENEFIMKIFDVVRVGAQEHVHHFVSTIENRNELNTNEITASIENIQQWITDQLGNSCLQVIYNSLYTNNPSSLIRIRQGFYSLWQDIASQLKTFCKKNKADNESSEIIVISLSRLCYDISDHSIDQSYNTFSNLFFTQTHSNTQSHQSSDLILSIDSSIIDDMTDIIDHYIKTGQTLLNKQIMQDGYLLSTQIQEAYLFIPYTTHTTDISPIWYSVSKQLKYIEQLMEGIHQQRSSSEGQDYTPSGDNSESDYENKPIPSSHSITTVSSISEATYIPPKLGNDITLNMMNNIDKLFAERVDIYRKIESTPTAVCNGLILIILKTFLEVVREMHIDTIIYQTIQSDVEYVRHLIWPYLGNEKWSATMLQEILSNAYARCLTPININQDQLE
ncbi:Vps51/Vps67-domain-containing protein [Pilobolus umbonatus]|nr:Vps51/Vps67-domain-containing protein [Pilobolus umbonatus]